MSLPNYRRILKSRKRLLSFAEGDDPNDGTSKPSVSYAPIMTDEQWYDIKRDILIFYVQFLTSEIKPAVIDDAAYVNKDVWITQLIYKFCSGERAKKLSSGFEKKDEPVNYFDKVIQLYKQVAEDKKSKKNIQSLYNNSHALYTYLTSNLSEFKTFYDEYYNRTIIKKTGLQRQTLNRRYLEGKFERFMGLLYELVVKMRRIVPNKLEEPGIKYERMVANLVPAFYDKIRDERMPEIYALLHRIVEARKKQLYPRRIAITDAEKSALYDDTFNNLKLRLFSGTDADTKRAIDRYINAVYRGGPANSTFRDARDAAEGLFQYDWMRDVPISPVEVESVTINLDISQNRAKVRELKQELLAAKREAYPKQDKINKIKKQIKKLEDEFDRLTDVPDDYVPPEIKYKTEEETRKSREQTREQRTQQRSRSALRSIKEREMAEAKILKNSDKISKVQIGEDITYFSPKDNENFEGQIIEVIRNSSGELEKVRIAIAYKDEDGDPSIVKQLVSADTDNIKRNEASLTFEDESEEDDLFQSQNVETDEINEDPNKIAAKDYILYSLSNESQLIKSLYARALRKIKINRGFR